MGRGVYHSTGNYWYNGSKQGNKKQPKLLASHCVCGRILSVKHVFSCPFGGFPSIRPNKLQLHDITAAFCQRSVITSVLNQLYNRCLGNISSIDLLILKMVLAWMSVQRVITIT